MRVLVVGGDFKDTPKESSVARKLAAQFQDANLVNGGSPDLLSAINTMYSDLIIWMPNVENEVEKHYPVKNSGSVLICSKVIHGERTDLDAIARIFKMHGNAVIAIYRTDVGFSFKLIDALGNLWYSGTNINQLAVFIKLIYVWSKESIRLRTTYSDFEFPAGVRELPKLIELNKQVADKFEAIGGRYFGNVSTRCMKMFPSARAEEEYIYVSRRNVDKRRITVEDFVKVKLDNRQILYSGEHKPSVDTPIQAHLYAEFPNIHYMIHGHSYIQGYPITHAYFPCGDMREYGELKVFMEKSSGGVNLMNHGFLIWADTIANLETIVNNLVFIEREVAKERIGMDDHIREKINQSNLITV